MSFRVGQKVVCVDASGHRPSQYWPVEGAVYTIEKLRTGNEGVLICLLCEIRRSATARLKFDDPELGYAASRFRPVVEKKTDISIFTAMLKKVDA